MKYSDNVFQLLCYKYPHSTSKLKIFGKSYRKETKQHNEYRDYSFLKIFDARYHY